MGLDDAGRNERRFVGRSVRSFSLSTALSRSGLQSSKRRAAEFSIRSAKPGQDGRVNLVGWVGGADQKTAFQGHPGQYAVPPHPGVAEGAITETDLQRATEEEMRAKKMKDAMRGGDLGPEQFEQEQEKQAGAMQRVATTQGAAQAAQAQAAQGPPPTPPSAPSGSAGALTVHSRHKERQDRSLAPGTWHLVQARKMAKPPKKDPNDVQGRK